MPKAKLSARPSVPDVLGSPRARRIDGVHRIALNGDVYLHAKGGGRRVAPDIILYLAPRVPPSSLSFAVEHDGPPDLVLEQLSVGTWKKDVGVGDGPDDKKRFYAECGVREYWIYDPEGHRTDSGPILQGFRLHADKQYREITPVPEDKLWWSDVLQTHWGVGPSETRRRGDLRPTARARSEDRGLVRHRRPTHPGTSAG